MRRLSTIATLIILVVAAGAATLGAQAPTTTRPLDASASVEKAIKAGEDAARREAALKDWKAPRTSWGDPDLRGVWNVATYTPLQRPRELGNKAFYTEDEALAWFKSVVEADAAVDPKTVHYDWKEYGMDAWQGGARPSLRTSLIVDPADGRLPPLTPEAQQRQAARAAAARQRDPAAGVRTMPNTYTRCILGNGAAPLVRGGNPGAEGSAGGVTSEVQFFQSPGFLTMVMQSNNDVRIIPIDNRPHLPSGIRQWYGDSRGHWEGDTLVIDTTNFNDRSPATNFMGATDALHLVERIRRVGPNTVEYDYTMADPKTWTRPWSVESQMPRVDPNLVYEFACHEQNYGLINVVRGTQTREREAAATGGAAAVGPAAGGER